MLEIIPPYVTLPIVLVGYSAACLGLGILILKLMEARTGPVQQIAAGTILATGFILGQAVASSIWLSLALGGWFSFRVVASLCFIFAVSGLYLGRNFLAAFWKQIGFIWHELREDSWGWQLLAGLVILTGMLWLTSLARPLAGDGPAFYLALGKFIASSHRLIPMPGFEGFSNIGLQGELHFAALMLLHSPDAAKLFSWPMVLAAGIMLASLARMVGMRQRGQWLILSMLFSSTAVLWLSGDGKVDVFSMALGLAAYYWAVRIRSSQTKIALLLTGLLTGFSIVAKLSYAVVMVPSIALLVLWGYFAELENKKNFTRYMASFLGSSLLILLGLSLALLPHLIKNGLLFNNPISPIGAGSLGWLNQSWFDAATTRKILLSYPLALTYGSYWAQYGNLSPLILAFLPLSFFLHRPHRLASSLLWITTLTGLIAVASWIIYNPSVFAPRYMLASLFLFTLLPARAAEHVSYFEQHPRFLSISVLVLATSTLFLVGSYLLDLVFFPGRTITYLKGKVTECDRDRIYSQSRICVPMGIINRKAEQGVRVYVASYQHYWLRGDLLQCSSNVSDRVLSDVKGEDLWLTLFQDGFSYLLFDTSTHKTYFDNLDILNPPTWVKVSVLYKIEPFYAYQVEFTNPPSTARPKFCQRMPSSTIWEVVSP